MVKQFLCGVHNVNNRVATSVIIFGISIHYGERIKERYVYYYSIYILCYDIITFLLHVHFIGSGFMRQYLSM